MICVLISGCKFGRNYVGLLAFLFIKSASSGLGIDTRQGVARPGYPSGVRISVLDIPHSLPEVDRLCIDGLRPRRLDSPLSDSWVFLLLVPPVFKGQGDAGHSDADENDDEDAAWNGKTPVTAVNPPSIEDLPMFCMLMPSLCSSCFSQNALSGLFVHHFSFSFSSFLLFRSWRMLQGQRRLVSRISFWHVCHLRVIELVLERRALLHRDCVRLPRELFADDLEVAARQRLVFYICRITCKIIIVIIS